MSEQVKRKWPMSEHVRMLVSLLDEEYGRDPNKFTAEQAALNAAIDALDRPTPPAAGGEMGEAVAWTCDADGQGMHCVYSPEGSFFYGFGYTDHDKHTAQMICRALNKRATPVAAGGVVVPSQQIVDWIGYDKAMAYIAAAPQQSAQGGWLPIESAPRDGTRIFVWSPRDGAVISFWTYGYTGRHGNKQGWTYGASDDIDRVFHNYPELPPCEPTHWRPMFEAPEA